MEVGSLGEWVGALATAAATAVALYFGVRDDEARRRRARARDAIHTLAGERLRIMRRWQEGLDEPDGTEARESRAMDEECRPLVQAALALSRRRRAAALSMLREAYGERSVLLAELSDEGSAPEQPLMNETMRLVVNRPDLAIDPAPGPLRRRAAKAGEGAEFDRLLGLFERLSRI